MTKSGLRSNELLDFGWWTHYYQKKIDTFYISMDNTVSMYMGNPTKHMKENQ